MRNRLVIAILAGALLVLGGRGIAADKADVKSEAKGQAKADLQVLVGKVQNKLTGGKRTEKDLADELKEFDLLLAKYKGEKADDVAQILLMKAMLYLQVFDDMKQGEALIHQLKSDFPETGPGKRVEAMLAQIQQQGELKKKQEEAGKIQSGLAVGVKFPDFQEMDLDGKPLSVAKYRGKVVLVDFWATWCGPCVGELPNVLKTYAKFHPKGFEIVGISLDSDKAKLTAFMEKQKVTWQQYFDGQKWGNKLAIKYGVDSIPATYLLDTEGKIIAKNLRGEELETEVAKALEKH